MNRYLNKTKLTEETKIKRESALAFAMSQGFSDNFTCDSCPDVNTCEYAFDLYSTNGDCLAEK